jgi:hypothetical protein
LCEGDGCHGGFRSVARCLVEEVLVGHDG